MVIGGHQSQIWHERAAFTCGTAGVYQDIRTTMLSRVVSASALPCDTCDPCDPGGIVSSVLGGSAIVREAARGELRAGTVVRGGTAVIGLMIVLWGLVVAAGL
jgi:hypothetical protein